MARLLRTRCAGSCLRGCLLLTVSMSLLPAGLGKHFSPFFDPDCTGDCSWPYSKNGIPARQFCDMTTSRPDGLTDQCHNLFEPPKAFSDRPSKPENVRVTDFNKEISSSDGELEQYTCITIKYNLAQYAAEKIKGLQLSLRPLSMPDLNRFYCINLNFTKAGLDYFAVLDENGQQADLTFSCFCGVMPGEKYHVAVRTMPVDITNGSIHNTIIGIDYRLPACNDPAKRNDVRCLKSPEAQWEPKCISIKQNMSTPLHQGDYDLVEVSFDAAPESYCFFYGIYIHQEATKEFVAWATVHVDKASIANRSCSGLHNESVPFVVVHFNARKGYRDKPWPSPGTGLYVRIRPFNPESCQTCKNADGTYFTCRNSFKYFSMIDDPCETNPCGQYGQCISNEERYRCDCLPGYMNWEKTCRVDPCQSGLNFTNPCGEGECNYTPEREDHICYCPENYLNVGKTCMVDPCSTNPKTNTTTCGVHGQCSQNVTDDSVSHICLCDPGYIIQDNDMCEEVTQPVWIAVLVVGSCVAGLLLFVMLLCFVARKHPCVKPVPCSNYNGIDEGPRMQVTYTPVTTHPHRRKSEDVELCKQRVLPIFSEDHPKHKDAVVNFCRFLQWHLKCEMSLLDWKTPIGPTVEMWLSAEIEKADVVLLLCSKGTRVKYEAKAKRDQVPVDSLSEYGDVFVKALTLLDDYFSRDNADKKFVVAYFDYSSEDDIPVTFRRFAKFRLMQCMEALFFRIHGTMRDSPHSSRRVPDLDRYQDLEMGRPLHKSIKAMRELIESDCSWYENHASHNRRYSSGVSGYVSDQQDCMPSQLAQAPSWFFDRISSGHGSDTEDYEHMMSDFDNALPVPQGNDASMPMMQLLHQASSSTSLPETHLAIPTSDLASDHLLVSDSGFANSAV